MATQAFCLKRSNHLNDMVDDLEKMLKDENMVDVSLSCEDGIIKAHKIILSACSTYFRQIFCKVQLNNQYPIIIIKDMSYQDLKYIIDFIYRGEVLVPEVHLSSVLKSAEALKIKGLADVNSQQRNDSLSSENKNLSDEHNLNRKKKKKKRKTAHGNLQDQDKNKEQIKQQNLISSEDVSDEYSSEDDIHHHSHQSHNTQSSHPLSHHNLLQKSLLHNSPVLNETEIEPSRLLEQTMITGDAQNISNLQSLSQSNNQNKYPQYLISSVKQMMYDDSTGLIASHLGTSDQASVSSNHNLTIAQFDDSSSLAGPSNISLIQRQNEEHSFNNNSTTTANHNSQMPLVPTNLSSNSTGQQSTSLNNQSTTLSASLLPMQRHHTSLNISAGLPVTGRSSHLAFNFDTLPSKRHYSCPVCYKTFSEKGNMKRHTAIHQSVRTRFVCDICSKCFVWKDNHARHLRLAHPNITP